MARGINVIPQPSGIADGATIQYDLWDDLGGNYNIVPEDSKDAGVTWNPLDVGVGGDPLTNRPAGTIVVPLRYSFNWDTDVDWPGVDAAAQLLKLTMNKIL